MPHMVQLDETAQDLVSLERAAVLEDREADRIIESSGQLPPLLVKNEAHCVGGEHLERILMSQLVMAPQGENPAEAVGLSPGGTQCQQ